MKYSLIEEYYKSHRGELLAFVSNRLRGNIAAEDIVQNVFLRLMTTDKMVTETTLPALVYKITNNLIIDHYRRRTTFDAYEHYLKGTWTESQESAESVLSIREITERLESGLARLPENCRDTYRLHIYGDLKVGEISKILGEGYKHVEYHLGIARKAMRQYMRQAI